jgi:hypothetical protein
MAVFNRAQSGNGARSIIHFQKAISANPYKYAGGAALNAGAVQTGGFKPNLTYNLTLATDAFYSGRISGRVLLAVSAISSGNIGTTMPIAGGSFGKMEKGSYVGMVIGTRIARTSNTVLQSTAASFFRKKGFTLTPYYRYQLLGYSGWDYVSGRPYYSGSQGTTITFNQDKSVSLSNSLQGNLRFLYGAPLPSGGTYSQRNNW